MGTLTITLEEKSRTVKIAALGKSTGEKESAIITIIEELSKISYTCSHVGVLDFTYQFNESVPDSEQQQIGGVIRRLKEKKEAEMKQLREDWDAKALAEHLAFERELELDMQRYMAECYNDAEYNDYDLDPVRPLDKSNDQNDVVNLDETPTLSSSSWLLQAMAAHPIATTVGLAVIVAGVSLAVAALCMTPGAVPLVLVAGGLLSLSTPAAASAAVAGLALSVSVLTAGSLGMLYAQKASPVTTPLESCTPSLS